MTQLKEDEGRICDINAITMLPPLLSLTNLGILKLTQMIWLNQILKVLDQPVSVHCSVENGCQEPGDQSLDSNPFP